MKLQEFWYIAARSKELTDKPKAKEILGRHLALFRGDDGKAYAIEDRCLHRNAKLSEGFVKDGDIVCPYHGWAYNKKGELTDIPSERMCKTKFKRQQKMFPVREEQGYIYVWPSEKLPSADQKPFTIPYAEEKGYHRISLTNHFENTVTNCVENFVDIPHTVFVHPGIFRVRRDQRFTAEITRKDGTVEVHYANETDNLGFFSRFLNPESKEIVHYDRFHMPNVTCVEYYISKTRHFIITSQSIPVGERETLVYTDLTYNYGFFSKLAAPLIKQQAQTIIRQDQVILKNQNENIKKFGESFQNSPSDQIHIMIESIRNALEKEKDPKELGEKKREIEFWI